MIRQAGETALRGSAFLLNFTLFGICVLGGLLCGQEALSRFEAAGGMPEFTVSHLMSLVNSPDIANIALNYGSSWVLFCVTLGFIWMSVLGSRWFFHTALRTTLK